MAGLLERADDLEVVSQTLAAASGGDGQLLVVEGAAGIGKTAILGETTRIAGKNGFQILQARPSEMERDLAWGVIRDLFTPALRGLTSTEQAELTRSAARAALPILGEGELARHGMDVGDLLHGLYWFVVELCTRRPLVIAVDDLHWADQDSLRALGYLAARVEDLAVLLAVAFRPKEPGTETASIDAIVEQGVPVVVRPQPLSEAACGELLGEQLGPDLDPEVPVACRAATGGNPYLLNELVGELSRERLPLTSEMADQLLELRPDTVRRGLLIRLARMGPQARDLAEAVAIFDGSVGVEHAANLANLDLESAVSAADQLAAIEVLLAGEPLQFTHPLVRSVLYGEIPAVRRSSLHRRAAEILATAGAGSDAVATHLLATTGSGDPAVAERLIHAARGALARGAYEAAARYLRRALEEPCPEDRRADVLLDLGRAEVRSSAGARASARFREAFEAESDPKARAEIALEHARTLRMMASFVAGAELLQASAEELEPGTELAWEVEGELLNVGLLDLSRSAMVEKRLTEIGDGLDPASIRAPGLLADLAILQVVLGQPRETVVGLASRALELLNEREGVDVSAVVYAATALCFADEYEAAGAAWKQLRDSPEWRDSPLALGFSAGLGSESKLRAGAIRDAEADIRLAVQIFDDLRRIDPSALVPAEPPIPEMPAFLMEVLIETGELEEAEDIARQGWEAERLPEIWVYNRYLSSRGWLRVIRGEPEKGVVDLRECGRRQLAFGNLNPAVLAWRSRLALGLLALGERQEAETLAAEELHLARGFGAPRAIGIALMGVGRVQGGAERLKHLEEAVSVLDVSPARLECARARYEMGRALRQAMRGKDAQEHLRVALDVASRCGATALAEAARAELSAAGARPRRAALWGREALTAMERRVAEMAASGMTNKQIAQALFVSLRTVETHLTHTYRKLDVGRSDLAAVLSDEDPAP